MLREAKKVHVEEAVTVTTIDGDSMSVARAAQKYISGTEALVREEMETKEQDIDPQTIQDEILKSTDEYYEQQRDYGINEGDIGEDDNTTEYKSIELEGESPFYSIDDAQVLENDQEPTGTER